MPVTDLASDFKWKKNHVRERPLKSLGIVSILLLRYFFGVYFFVGAFYKLSKNWLWTDALKILFQRQLETLNQLNDIFINQLNGNRFFSSVEPHSPLYAFEPYYLEHFAIPFYLAIAWVVTLGELMVGLSLVLGLAVRINSAVALFILLNFAAGGYFQFHTSFPLMFCALLFMCLPSGQWFGLDKKLHEKYPDSLWFK
ncbi:MAG: DoxX family protein [Chlorobiales bacterium]|nr:DoxX family protein [Chlorobiales bacterium]